MTGLTRQTIVAICIEAAVIVAVVITVIVLTG